MKESTRIAEHVDRLAEEHPPIPLASVDLTVRDPDRVRRRFGTTVAYMARVELEVERNIRELDAVLPHAPDTDIVFYRDVWGPQELAHGAILDAVVRELRMPSVAPVDVTVSGRLRVLGRLGAVRHIEDVSRMLYYLTGVSTERVAHLAYHSLTELLLDDGERALALTAIDPIRRQEPGHLAFYRLSAEQLGRQLRPWQRWLVRRLRQATFSPPGVTDDDQSAQFGVVIRQLDLAAHIETEAAFLTGLTRRLLQDEQAGLPVPDYVKRGFLAAAARADAIYPEVPRPAAEALHHDAPSPRMVTG